jgi:hypothetical protein
MSSAEANWQFVIGNSRLTKYTDNASSRRESVDLGGRSVQVLHWRYVGGSLARGALAGAAGASDALRRLPSVTGPQPKQSHSADGAVIFW